jgi:hypothetical protein
MVMTLVFAEIVEVINIVHFDLELLSHLEVILDVDLRDPLRINVITDPFSFSDF